MRLPPTSCFWNLGITARGARNEALMLGAPTMVALLKRICPTGCPSIKASNDSRGLADGSTKRSRVKFFRILVESCPLNK